MKYTLLLLFTIISFSAANAQFTVKKIIKPTEATCDGKIVLEFKESELPATLTTASQSAGGVSTVESKTFTLNNLCADTYTISMVDNHDCETEEEVILEECDLNMITHLITRENCENENGYKIELQDLPQEILYYQWSKEGEILTNEKESSISKITYGNYAVTISDEYKCEQILYIEIEDTHTSIADIIHPTFNGDGCDGRVKLEANETDVLFKITLKVNFESVFTTTRTLNDEPFEIPVDLCYHDEISVVVIDPYGCMKEFPINLIYSNCESIDLKIDALWHASNWDVWDNGYVRVKLTDPNLDPNDFMFKYYLKIGSYEVLFGSGIGMTEMDGLSANCQKYDWKECGLWDNEEEYWQDNLSYWYCDYIIKMEEIDGSNCEKMVNFKIRQCSNSIPFNLKTFPDTENYLNSEGKVKISWWADDMHILDSRFNHFTYKLTGPSGEIFIPDFPGYSSIFPDENAPDFCQFASPYMYFTAEIHEPGEYCLKVDDGCGNVKTYCHEIYNCDESINLKSNGTLVYPINRDHSSLGEGYEHIKNSFLASTYNACILYDDSAGDFECINNNKYYDNANFCNEDKIHFAYTPNDENNPCDGGIVEMYDIKEEFGRRKVYFNTSFEVSGSADYEFKWANTYNPSAANASGFRYAHLQAAIKFNEICKNGTYCLYEASQIFSDLVSNKYFLFSTCEEMTNVCEIYPNSWECAKSYCFDGIQNYGEVGVDCGGPCDPCPEDDDDDCFIPCDEELEDCVDGECLLKCDENTPCPEGYNCNENGHCIEAEGPCDENGDCPDGQICIENYCYEEDDDDPSGEECDNYCEDNGGECINDICYYQLCDGFDFFLELDDPNNDPPIDIEFFIAHDLGVDAIVQVINEGKAKGLSLTISQGSTELYYWECDGDTGAPNDIFTLISTEDLKVTVEPFHSDGSGCSAQAKHRVYFGLDCISGKPNFDLTQTNNLSSKEFNIYPNPFRDVVRIESKNDIDIIMLSVYNTSGQLLKSYKDLEVKNYDLNTEDWIPGVYFLNITTDAISQSVRILKVD